METTKTAAKAKCIGCGGNGEHASYICPVMRIEMADAKRKLYASAR